MEETQEDFEESILWFATCQNQTNQAFPKAWFLGVNQIRPEKVSRRFKVSRLVGLTCVH